MKIGLQWRQVKVHIRKSTIHTGNHKSISKEGCPFNLNFRLKYQGENVAFFHRWNLDQIPTLKFRLPFVTKFRTKLTRFHRRIRIEISVENVDHPVPKIYVEIMALVLSKIFDQESARFRRQNRSLPCCTPTRRWVLATRCNIRYGMENRIHLPIHNSIFLLSTGNLSISSNTFIFNSNNPSSKVLIANPLRLIHMTSPPGHRPITFFDLKKTPLSCHLSISEPHRPYTKNLLTLIL